MGGWALPADALREPQVEPEEIRRVVEDVLSRPEYADARPGLLQRALDRVLEAVARGFETAAGTGVGRLAGVLLLAALVALLVWLVARSTARLRWDRRQDSTVEAAPVRSAGDWLAAAAAHERDGELRQARRCHYRARLAWLAERGLVEEVPGTTTGEYRAAVRQALPEAAAPFDELTAAFERAWYGRRPVSRAEIDAAVAAAARVRARAGEPAVVRS